ncbi:hypothetical protein BDV33DRAFT_230164 [Aspergillus novoparasiticus]|uniref:AAA+ ATPase domain-containing protein n=1 Tax=Aspergillus novoparasiticus TaxID=986946 RepID=A0A5N6F7V0_9EURO|nr:hypothetical protein BDV33DRAFT_230164 [Aspergillus novoparasiticus]
MDHNVHKVKRRRLNSPLTFTPSPWIFTIHTVVCKNSELHLHHPWTQHYLDVPRLFKGDSKASPLRGLQHIDDIDEISKSDDIGVILFKTYSCNEYYSRIERLFDPLQQPKHPPLSNLLPYFYSLKEDGNEAQHWSERVELISSSLKNALHRLTDISLERLENLTNKRNIDELYHYFYFNRKGEPKGISALHNSDQDQVLAFRQFMECTFGHEYDEADRLFSQGDTSWKHLRKLFPPNEVVVTYRDGEPMAYLVQACYQLDNLEFSLDCHSWGFDGAFYQEKTQFTLKWASTEEERIEIQDLEVYPLKYDDTGVEETLRRRGEKFWQCRQRRFIAYTAPQSTFELRTSNPRYMVDMQMYQQIHVDNNPPVREYGGPDVTEAIPPNDPFLLLLPATIHGFGFHDKKWRTLSVKHLSDIKWNTEAFKHLVLHHTKKDLIEALIFSHNSVIAPPSTDVIEGKGNGLILLLHGGPGTGKTLTAESVAELTERPLYRVTCGDIGTNAEDIEGYLETVFHLGTQWNCVVLLDEADIFLEERSPADLQRNALVSVFLRVLEYYEGILILTSNRIGTFDEAFKSRVQLTLHYPPLDQDGRQRIWNNFINRLDHSGVKAHIDKLKDKVDMLSAHELNGREIRNAIQTATLLAQFRGQTLGPRHLKEVIKISNEFEQYLTDVHGHSSSEWARAQGTRAD